MKKKWTQVLTVVLLVVLAVSGGYILVKNLEYRESDRLNAEAASIAGLPPRIEAPPQPAPQQLPEQQPDPAAADPDPEPDPEDEEPEDAQPEEEAPVEAPDPYAVALSEANFQALQEVNGDVVGWITIPETDLSYPLLHGTDNEFYLNHAWNGKKNSSGSIFLECECAPDMSDFNTIIYGHRMRNSTMFGTLREYAAQSFWKKHPCVYIATESGIYRYDIFAAYEVGIREIVYRLYITETEDKQELIRLALDSSVIQTGIVPGTDDQIVTLSTCTGDGHATRWVVQAVLRDRIDSLGEV